LNENELIPHLFRTEYSKIVAVLCKTFGLSNIEVAEDIVSDTFVKAVETWGVKGIPENPTAWLYQVAKNNAIDLFRRQQLFDKKIAPELQLSTPTITEFDFSDENINDSLLRMMFAVSHPSLTTESQVALALRALCGFSIDEIGNALLTSKENINKRLFRAKEALRTSEMELEDISQKDIEKRLDSVLSILYLLFNEGYFSTSTDEKIREDLCFEAMRLAHQLTKINITNVPDVNALLALFCFQTSRFESRINPSGEQILYGDQNPEKWNTELIEKGELYLVLSSSKSHLSKYKLEAMIAFWHTRRSVEEHEKWNHILLLYNLLLQKQYSPITALNRTYALAKVKGNKAALQEALKIKLEGNSLFHSLLSELYKDSDNNKSIEHLKTAIKLTKNENDRALLEKKLKQALTGALPHDG
jgi:RNA polymerase sigma-70 factor (ECF subfamily)